MRVGSCEAAAAHNTDLSTPRGLLALSNLESTRESLTQVGQNVQKQKLPIVFAKIAFCSLKHKLRKLRISSPFCDGATVLQSQLLIRSIRSLYSTDKPCCSKAPWKPGERWNSSKQALKRTVLWGSLALQDHKTNVSPFIFVFCIIWLWLWVKTYWVPFRDKWPTLKRLSGVYGVPDFDPLPHPLGKQDQL